MHSVRDVNVLDDALHLWDIAMPLAHKVADPKGPDNFLGDQE